MRLVRTLGAMLATGALLAACGGDDDAGDSDGAEAPEEAMVDEPADDAEAAGGEGGDGTDSSGTVSGAASIDPAPRHVIYTIDLVVETDDVARAAARAAVLAESSGGFVAHESTEGGKSATLTLRVPSARHATVVAELEGFGEVQQRSRTAEDVTAEVVDVEARVTSQRRSLERIRSLLDEAGDLSDVVRIEAELAGREADLDSLLRRQEQLASLTTLATVTVTFYQTDEAPADAANALGFMGGLRGGWDAFVATVSVAGAVAGALLPFAGAAALIGVPAWLVWRRRRAGSAGSASEPPRPSGPGRPAPQPEG